MENKQQRQLRNNVSCTAFENIFRNEKYILSSGCHYLPEDIYKKINKFSALTCDEINSLTFVKNEPHEHVLGRMKDALSAQQKMISSNLNFQLEPGWSHLQEGIRIIKSEERECEDEEILNHPCFKNDLENILLS